MEQRLARKLLTTPAGAEPNAYQASGRVKTSSGCRRGEHQGKAL